jgi:cell division septation protein DedD
MEDQSTWKGHTFTLLVFTGIVVLCSIFFILGMLVGRTQGQKIAGAGTPVGTPAKADAKASKDDKPDFTFYDSVKKGDPATLLPAPTKKEPEVETPAVEAPKKAPPEVEAKPEPKVAAAVAPPAPAPPPEPPPVPAAPSNVVNYQIGLFSNSANADKLLDDVKKKGFRAFILTPSEGEPNPVFRVQVGPFSDVVEAEEAKKKLESEGYKPILKK